MVNIIKKKGYKATENIFEGDFIEGEEINDVLDLFEDCIFYECGNCSEYYTDKFEAEECCKDEEED